MGHTQSYLEYNANALAPTLPVNDVWVHHIFPALPGTVAWKLRCVSKKWLAQLNLSITSIRPFQGNDAQIKHVAHTCPNLEALTLVTSRVNEHIVARLTRLRVLSLGFSCVFGDQSISSLTNLTDLRIPSNTKITNKAVTLLTNIANLSICEHGRVTVRALHALPRLRKLHVTTTSYVGRKNSFYNGLSTLTGLVSLYDDTPGGVHYGFRDRDLMSLTNLTCLVGVAGCELTDKSIRTMTNLRTLTLHGAPGITDAALSHLTKLTALSLFHCDSISDVLFPRLTCLTRLVILNSNSM